MQVRNQDDEEGELLLTKEKFEDIAKEFEDEEIAVLGRRAITQITSALEKERMKDEEDRQKRIAEIARRSNEEDKVLEEKQDQGRGK